MKKKSVAKKNSSSKKISNTKLMFLGFILLFIVFEAIYVSKSQSSLQANSLQKDVAGVHTQK